MNEQVIIQYDILSVYRFGKNAKEEFIMKNMLSIVGLLSVMIALIVLAG
jgi:hypothetical protein